MVRWMRFSALGQALAAMLTLAACAGVPAPSIPLRAEASGATQGPASPVAAVAPSSTTTAPPDPTEVPGRPDDMFQRILDVIAAHRPDLVLRLERDRLDDAVILDGNVDDGAGEGRLYIVATKSPGALTAHPCGDRDFHQGGPCTERLLANGDRLVTRGIVEANGTRTIEIVVIHPDRSGVSAESTNFPIDLSRRPLTPNDPRRQPVATRPDPVYTVDELAGLSILIAERIRDCPTVSC